MVAAGFVHSFYSNVTLLNGPFQNKLVLVFFVFVVASGVRSGVNNHWAKNDINYGVWRYSECRDCYHHVFIIYVSGLKFLKFLN